VNRSVLLKSSGLGMNYGKFAALSDVNLEVRERTIHSVIGPNGAGKTTLFHCLTGSRIPTKGHVEFAGQDITRLPNHKRTGIGMSRSFQITSLFQNLSVRENLRLSAQGRNMLKAMKFWGPVESLAETIEIAEQLLERLSLTDCADVLAGELSHGQQRILEVGMAMAAKPKMLLLDEPTSGMGIEDIPVMTNLIHELGKELTILLIEHNMGIVMSISDIVTVMYQGQVLVEGTPEVVSEDERVRIAYLGEAV
jgi:branched-chain amino acid transport system ATP-binding protein